MNVNDLEGYSLDWAVAKSEGLPVGDCWKGFVGMSIPKYSTVWTQGGPIIEREGISIQSQGDTMWMATIWFKKGKAITQRHMHSESLLIAAMRAYVASKLGDEIE